MIWIKAPIDFKILLQTIQQIKRNELFEVHISDGCMLLKTSNNFDLGIPIKILFIELSYGYIPFQNIHIECIPKAQQLQTFITICYVFKWRSSFILHASISSFSLIGFDE